MTDKQKIVKLEERLVQLEGRLAASEARAYELARELLDLRAKAYPNSYPVYVPVPIPYVPPVFVNPLPTPKPHYPYQQPFWCENGIKVTCNHSDLANQIITTVKVH